MGRDIHSGHHSGQRVCTVHSGQGQGQGHHPGHHSGHEGNIINIFIKIVLEIVAGIFVSDGRLSSLQSNTIWAETTTRFCKREHSRPVSTSATAYDVQVESSSCVPIYVFLFDWSECKKFHCSWSLPPLIQC